jgi:hypothetical protein
LSEKVVACTQCNIVGENSNRAVQEDKFDVEKYKFVIYQENIREKVYEDIISAEKVEREPEVLPEKSDAHSENTEEKWLLIFKTLLVVARYDLLTVLSKEKKKLLFRKLKLFLGWKSKL